MRYSLQDKYSVKDSNSFLRPRILYYIMYYYQRIKHLEICITFDRKKTAFQKYFATLTNQIIQIHAYNIFDQLNCTLQNPKHRLQTPRTWINTRVHIPVPLKKSMENYC